MRHELIQRLYDVVKEVYPDVELDRNNEPKSAIIHIVETKYQQGGETYPRKYYDDGTRRWQVIGDKVMRLHIHLYFPVSEGDWNVEPLEARLLEIDGVHLTNPDREVPIRLVNLTTEKQRLWEAVFTLEAIDQVFKEATHEV